MKRLLAAAASLALAFTGSGCASFTNMGSARTLQKGATQVMIAPELEGISANGGTTAGQATIYGPQLEIGVHHGISDSFELGAKLWLVGAELDGKFALIRPEDPDNGFNLSIDPGFGYMGVGSFATGNGSSTASFSMFTIYLPLLAGFRFSGNELTLAPKLIDQVVISSAGSGNLLYAGGSVGFGIKISDGFKLMPEASVVYPIVTGVTNVSFPGFVFQAGLGFLIGGAEERRSSTVAPLPANTEGTVAPSGV